ncbi:MAG: FAD-dependent oxidoreductase [Clostridia bacterium]|nr:FAD-dependent oxidoreductase [Clostridia bacterium]
MADYVIIGGGIASVACVEGIRKKDKLGKIYLISGENKPTYCRPLISYYLQGLTDFNKMKYRPDEFYTDNNCELIYDYATSINPKEQKVYLKNGEIKYDKLCVATGSSPFIPPFNGLDTVDKKFTFITEDDALAIEQNTNKDSNVLIIGAGLIGLKCAEGICEKVNKITVTDLSTRVLSSILDDECASFMQKKLEEHNIDFLLGDSIVEINTNTALFKSGKLITFDVLILAVGVRTNTAIFKSAGGLVNRGIIVNEKQETSLANIYSAGDCAEGFDSAKGEKRVLAILPNAYMQGFTAGLNMAGDSATLTNSIPMNSIGFFGLYAMTAGIYEGEMYEEKDAEHIKRLFFKDNCLIGFIIIGKINGTGIYTDLIRNKTKLSDEAIELIKKSPSLTIYSKETRKKVLGGC